MAIKRIAVLTTGGDAPGMNPAIRAVVRTALRHKLEIYGVFRGYWGLINEDLKPLNHRSVSGIINLGGTILKTMRCPEFFTPEGKSRAWKTLQKFSIDGMIVLGGNGSLTALHEFYKEYKVPCIGIPASIDNDINGIDSTIGLDTAVNTALTAIDNIRDTSSSMERVFVVEVMGRESGFIAMEVALAGGCEEVIVPEFPYNLQKICQEIVDGTLVGKMSWIIVVAEGAGKADDIASQISEMTGLQTRTVVLGHIQRGGRPTAFSRSLAATLGHAAVERLVAGETAQVVRFHDGLVDSIGLEFARKKKELNLDQAYALLRALT
ncbi:MAG TPA: 6-phosphofructokinase [Candidatus Omnitrophota bacterium]|nr:6-phosphofructokinase [Candidatus Omnitrophota bacterium]HPT07250.1 6-phosphofructokinase [Candidatus Omnitrophota bacterium]